MSLPELFDTYLKHGLYLRGWSSKTAVIYKRAFTSFQKSLRNGSVPEAHSTEGAALTKAHLEAWVISRREAGMSPCGINIYIRAMNSFSAWLKEEHGCEQVVLKQLKAPQKVINVVTDADIRLLLAFRPRTLPEWRIHVLLQTLLDTGCRINEIIELAVADVDMDNLLFSVTGKGNKQRKVPFSSELRKVVFRYSQLKDKRGLHSGFVFCTRDGGALMYDNIYRDIRKHCKRVGITKRVHPHLFRHTFSCHWIKRGGSPAVLSRILGHSSLTTTNIYLKGLGVEDFGPEQLGFSPLNQNHHSGPRPHRT